MTTTVRTEYSVYEVDGPAKRMRRVSGKNAPTPNQRSDGEWRDYTDMWRYQGCLFVVWGMDGNILRQTLTSVIQSMDGDTLDLADKTSIL